MKMNILFRYATILTPFFISMLLTFSVMGQNPEVEMADKFAADGKIYVVIGVFGIVMAVMFMFLFSLDRKIRRLENDIKN